MKAFFRPLYDAWMRFAHVLGWINSRIILTVLYFTIIGLYAIVRKIFGLFKSHKPVDSYWIEKEQVSLTLEDLRQIF